MLQFKMEQLFFGKGFIADPAEFSQLLVPFREFRLHPQSEKWCRYPRNAPIMSHFDSFHDIFHLPARNRKNQFGISGHREEPFTLCRIYCSIFLFSSWLVISASPPFYFPVSIISLISNCSSFFILERTTGEFWQRPPVEQEPF